MSVSSSSWALGKAAVCDCCTPWTFLLPFFQILRQEELTSKTALKLIKLKYLKELGLPLGSTEIIENEIQIWNKVQNIPDKLGNSEKGTLDININAEILAGQVRLDVLLNDQLPLSDTVLPQWLEPGWLVYRDSNSFFSPYKILPIPQENKYLGIFSYFTMELYVVCTH